MRSNKYEHFALTVDHARQSRSFYIEKKEFERGEVNLRVFRKFCARKVPSRKSRRESNCGKSRFGPAICRGNFIYKIYELGRNFVDSSRLMYFECSYTNVLSGVILEVFLRVKFHLKDGVSTKSFLFIILTRNRIMDMMCAKRDLLKLIETYKDKIHSELK